MSDSYISLIPTVSEYPNQKIIATDICTWLITEAIIKPEASACILSTKPGYSVSEQAQKAVYAPSLLPFHLATNGLEIVTERTVFSTELEELICPNCKYNIASDDWDLTPWLEQRSIGMICPQCAQEASIEQYTFRPDWGFSNLGFTFWNWPILTQQFIKAFEAQLGCPVSVVYGKV
ncbi:hypothetical protein [Hymenobacter sp. BT559]|uniref:hypothetical protein n=1 Tax=Hymenobacter sp. BT559 TaxID=2795729 RepID=UPI0018EE1FF9|nr:hypothetical protein [Hymenobacter sp. BT559]MBJ6145484.1 hypothetical protein [Hymenobacter sp. BT559]